MKERYREIKFNEEKASILAKCNRYIDDTMRAGYKVTLRQIYYHCISKDHLPASWIDEDYNRKHGLSANTKNTIKNYKRLGELLNDGKYAGLVDWAAVEDRTRNIESVSHWRTPADIIQSCADCFRIDKWLRQPRRPEVWVEKDALVGVLEKVCRELDVPWYSCRGYASSPELYEAGKRMARYQNAGQEPVIIYLGDHDPSGIDMTRDIEERVNVLGRTTVEVVRIALTRAQVDEVDAPPNPAKLTDSRITKYVQDHGEDSWELDALPIEYLDRIIRETVVSYRDEELWEAAVEEEEKHRRHLDITTENWEEVAHFIEREFGQ